MTAPRFEIVQSPAGFHARFRSSNGNIIMSSEVYTRRRGALRAVELIAGAETYYSPFQDWPEIRHGNLRAMVEIRDIDEREVIPADLSDGQALSSWAAQHPPVKQYIKADKKIHAIKELRNATGASLLQAKTAIDLLMPARRY